MSTSSTIYYDYGFWLVALTACLWVFARRLSHADTLVLFCVVLEVLAKIPNIAELRVVEEDDPSTTDSLQRGKIYLL